MLHLGPFSIVVCIKAVPDPKLGSPSFDPVTKTVRRAAGELVINLLDKNALEEALKIREEFGGEVTVLSMGPPEATPVLREALALGADRAFLLSDRAFAGADTLATSKTLARAVNQLDNFDLILCGSESSDGGTAQVGAQLAELLGIPYVGKVTRLQVYEGGFLPEGDAFHGEGAFCQGEGACEGSAGNERLLHRPETCLRPTPVEDRPRVSARVWGKVEHGVREYEVSLPALFAASRELNTPKGVTMPGIIKSRGKQIGVLGAIDIRALPEEIGALGSPTLIREVKGPPPGRQGEIIPGDPKDAVQVLIEKLKARGALV